MSEGAIFLPGSLVEILPATWRDYNALRQLEKVCFPVDAWPLWDVISVLSLPKVVRFKATIGTTMVGFIAGERRSPKDVAWIATFGVLPEHRRKGIGSALLAACETRFTETRIRLSVRSSNYPALELYKKFGYQRVGKWSKYYQDGADAVILEKKRKFLQPVKT